MIMDIRPILATLTRHRVSALLITLEIALACAVLCNALFMAVARIDLVGLDSGVDEAALATLALNDCEGCNPADINGRWLDFLRRLRANAALPVAPYAVRDGHLVDVLAVHAAPLGVVVANDLGDCRHFV